MSSYTKNNHIPTLRFPGFVGEWEEKTISDIAYVLQGFGFPDKYQGQTTGDLPFCKVGDISAAVDKGERIISHAANYVNYSLLPTLHARPIPEGATIFAKIGEAIRSNKRIMTGCPCLIDNNAAAVKAKEGESDEFIFYLMSNVNLADYAGGIVPSVNKSTVETISVLIPPTIAEQKKIASCLSNIDSLIAAQNRIVAAVKEKKKGLMQQLFPQPGETTPRLRFPGFKGEWKEFFLGDSFDERTEKNRGDLPLLSLGDEGLVMQSDTKRKDNSNADKSKYLRVSVDDIAYNTMRMWQGRCVYANIEGIVSPAYTVCKPKEGIDSLFHYYLFKTKKMINLFHQNSQGLVSDTLNLKYEAFSKIKYYLPPSLEEQKKIASCLSEMDEIITAQGKLVEVLKSHKKGLMQQLFPQLDK